MVATEVCSERHLHNEAALCQTHIRHKASPSPKAAFSSEHNSNTSPATFLQHRTGQSLNDMVYQSYRSPTSISTVITTPYSILICRTASFCMLGIYNVIGPFSHDTHNSLSVSTSGPAQKLQIIYHLSLPFFSTPFIILNPSIPLACPQPLSHQLHHPIIYLHRSFLLIHHYPMIWLHRKL